METKVARWIRPWNGSETPDVIVMGAPLSKTSISPSGASLTPQAFRELFAAATTYDVDHDVDLATALTARDAGDARIHATDTLHSRSGVRAAVAHLLNSAPDAMLVVVGGDHSITAPAVEAFSTAWDGGVGLVQLDAHMDVRNLEDGGPTNGTPIRQLLEGGVVLGRNVVQIGLHAWSNSRPYREYAVAHGVTQITAHAVAHEAPGSIVERALAVAGDGTSAIYVTLDMDVLDQSAAPGVPAMIPGGMTTWQLMDIMYALGSDPRVRALDIVEVDASLDPRRATVRAALHAMLTFLSGYASRRTRGA